MSSSASFRKVDYSLRPAKHAERKMLNEVFRRLRPFQPVEDYNYVGLGSLWFSDFSLFHRTLGIKDMFSIERVKGAKSRIEANKPFTAVKVTYEESGIVLPQLDWSKRTFAWLDYDDPLSTGMLLDIRTVASRALSGSVLAISVQCQQAQELQDAEEDPSGPSAMARFRDQFGRELIPQEASEEDLSGWPLGALSRSVISAQIQSSLSVRNLGAGKFDIVSFIPICEIEYQDGARMTTLVGIFAAARDLNLVEACGFENLDFISKTGKPIRIVVPILTMREIRHIERQLPKGSVSMDYGTVPPGEADQFAEFYRYLPNFSVLEQ